MPSCAIKGCKSRGSNKNTQKKLSYYRFPHSINKKRTKLTDLIIIRQNAWIEAINRPNLNPDTLQYLRVCSRHFISGVSASLTDTNSPDWVPSIALGEFDQLDESKNNIQIKSESLYDHETSNDSDISKLLSFDQVMILEPGLTHKNDFTSFSLENTTLSPIKDKNFIKCISPERLINPKIASSVGTQTDIKMSDICRIKELQKEVDKLKSVLSNFSVTLDRCKTNAVDPLLII